MNRIVDLSEMPARVSVHEGRLRIESSETRLDLHIPDLAVVVFGLAPAHVTLPALSALTSQGVSVVVGGRGGMPVGLLLPIGGHSHTGERIAAQVAAPRPLLKRAWTAVVKAKLRAQARALDVVGGNGDPVRALIPLVRSGDPSNVEAQGAIKYWRRLFGKDFRRDRNLPGENQLLNYGYGVVRAIVGRSVCAAGLHPSISLHHRHRGNAYALVDDLIEPFRPIVDLIVFDMTRDTGPGLLLDPKRKRILLERLAGARLHSDGEMRSLFDVTHRSAASLAAYLMRRRSSWGPPAYDPPPPICRLTEENDGESDDGPDASGADV